MRPTLHRPTSVLKLSQDTSRSLEHLELPRIYNMFTVGGS
jgi:hypothetical protein